MADNGTTGGGSGYNINWDEVDENTDPFGLGAASRGTKLASSPTSTNIPPKNTHKTTEYSQPNLPVYPSELVEEENTNKCAEVAEASNSETKHIKSGTTKIKQNAKGPRPSPPVRTVSNTNPIDVSNKDIPDNAGMCFLSKYCRI